MSSPPLPGGVVTIEGERIVAVEPHGVRTPDVDLGDAAVIPGLVNAHTHGLGNFLKGRADRWTLELLLTGAGEMWDGQTLEDKYLNAYIGAIEMLLKGCTTCYDLTYGVPLASAEELTAVGQAYLDAGMRAVLAPNVSPGTTATPRSINKFLANASALSAPVGISTSP